MSITSDLTQIGIVEEVTYGVTPATPIFQVFSITGESLTGNANTQKSNSLNSDRQTLDSILTGLDVSGSLDFEFAKSPALTTMIESAMGSTTVAATTDRTLVVGNEQISYTVEKRFEDPNNPGVYLYHRYVGCVSNTLSLSLTAGQPVTGSVSIIGKELQTDTAIITGATYVVQTAFNVFRGPDVNSLVIDNVAGTLAPTLATACVTDINITINNNYRGIQCLGTLGNKTVAIGSFDAIYAQTIYFSHNQMMDDFLAQSLIDEVFTVGDILTDDHYTFTTTKGKFTSNVVVAGGKGSDVVNANGVEWLIDNTLPIPTTIQIATSEGL